MSSCSGGSRRRRLHRRDPGRVDRRSAVDLPPDPGRRGELRGAAPAPAGVTDGVRENPATAPARCPGWPGCACSCSTGATSCIRRQVGPSSTCIRSPGDGSRPEHTSHGSPAGPGGSRRPRSSTASASSGRAASFALPARRGPDGEHPADVDVIVDCQNGIPFFSPLFAGTDVPVVQVVHHVHQDQFDTRFPRPMRRWAGSWKARRRAGSTVRGPWWRCRPRPGRSCGVACASPVRSSWSPTVRSTVPDLTGPRDPDPTVPSSRAWCPTSASTCCSTTSGRRRAGSRAEGRHRRRRAGRAPPAGPRHGPRAAAHGDPPRLPARWRAGQPAEPRVGHHRDLGCRRMGLLGDRGRRVGCALRGDGRPGHQRLGGRRPHRLDRRPGHDFGRRSPTRWRRSPTIAAAQLMAADCQTWAHCFSWDRSAELLAGVVFGKAGEAALRAPTVAMPAATSAPSPPSRRPPATCRRACGRQTRSPRTAA